MIKQERNLSDQTSSGTPLVEAVHERRVRDLWRYELQASDLPTSGIAAIEKAPTLNLPVCR